MQEQEKERRVTPGSRTGIVNIPASKSRAHRLLIMAARNKERVFMQCSGISNDIQATIDCLKGLGCVIRQPEQDIIEIGTDLPDFGDDRDLVTSAGDTAVRTLPCRDSGSTLRFMMPYAGACGARVVFKMQGRLPERPLAPFDDELRAHGMEIRRSGDELYCSGQLVSGTYTLPGNVSSQYISGLLMSLPMLEGDSRLVITGEMESYDYIVMTLDAMRMAGISCTREGNTFLIPGGQSVSMPQTVAVEGDWSGAAFFLALGALSLQGVTVSGVDSESLQGDRAILKVLRDFGADVREDLSAAKVSFAPLKAQTIDASGIPDLVPVISVIAAAAEGTTRIVGAGRLRLKESDRLKTTTAMLKSIGADITELEDSLVIRGCAFDPKVADKGRFLKGGRIDSAGDHRIAMSAAVAASLCSGDVYVSDPECVKKSFASFWEDFEALTVCGNCEN
ncbi:MAG: 3-phosphoshikimate 1-carboxyvinyltransferase [Lachnospiraceae bacterium]|nr:3-phosphoshikimate 1-carboxyvinyltransferase [Lachnospiraceae bacterium]